jgi:PKD repeat protein
MINFTSRFRLFSAKSATVLAVVFCLIAPSGVRAADFVAINVDKLDQQWSSIGTNLYVYQPDHRIGSSTTNTFTGMVLPFLIPDLAGKTILGAELRTSIKTSPAAWVTTNYNMYADVYGVRSATNANTVASDYTNGTLLVDNWFKIDLELRGALLTTNSAELAAWLTAQVGTTGQKFVFFTVRPDALIVPSGNAYASVNSGDSATNPPMLILNFTTNPLPPFASFTASPTNGAAPLTVSFTDTSTGPITNRFWDFGDGETTNTTETVVSHTYTAAGTNTIQLTVSGDGGSTTYTKVITAFVPIMPSANFTVTPTNGLTPLTVSFNDTSTGTITNRFWDFGDGSTTNTMTTNVVHTYTNAGNKTVQLTASGPAGASTYTSVDCIQVTPGATIIANVADQQWDSIGTAAAINQTTGRIGSGVPPSTNSAIVTVANFDFNTAGTTSAAREKWSANIGTDVSDLAGTMLGLKAAVSIDGITTVLTATSTLANDYKLYYRGTDIALPADATGWDKLTIRLRQLTNGVPVDFTSVGTIFSDGLTGGFLPANIIPVTNAIIGGHPVTVTKDAVDKWLVVTYDLSAEATTSKFKQNFRLDPFQGANTGFEIDYIKLTAIGTDTNTTSSTTNLTAGLVVPFLIPDLAGLEIIGAELRTTLNIPIGSSVTNAGNVDVYGVRSDLNATPVASDYTDGTLLVDDWFKLEGGLTGTLSTSNSSALVSWLAGQVGTNGQKYVFLTIRPDVSEIPANAYAILNTGDATTNKPMLILTLHTPGGVNPPPLDDWRMKHFGTTSNTGEAADGANPMGDGIPNLVKYALGLSPTNSYAGSPYAPYSQQQAPQGFTYTFTYDPASGDVTLLVEATDDLLSGIWTDIDPLNAGNQVSVQNDTPAAGLKTITIKDNQTNAPHRFMRLKATNP